MGLSVRVLCSHFVKFGAFKAFEAGCFKGVTWVSYVLFKGVSVSQGCSQGVFRLFQGVFKGVSKVLLGCFMCV